MRTPAPPPRPRSRAPRRLAAIGAAAAGVALVFGVGRWSAADAPSPGATRASPVAAPSPVEPALPSLPVEPPRAIAAGVPVPPGLAAAPPSSAAAAVATLHARTQLERFRDDVVARCLPAAERGREGARIVFDVTFDASGREIARGISRERKPRARTPGTAPADGAREQAAALTRCLRQFPMGSLTIPPPGTRVGVKVALAFP